MNKPTRPTHRIKALAPDGRSSVVGAAWLNEDLSMTLHLNVGVVLRWDDELKLAAFHLTPVPAKETP